MDSGSAVKPVRQRRASRPKVKTGCSNCKNRRVKCDETRPQCIKCVRSGRQCDGYPAYRRTAEVAIPIAPRPQDGRSGSSSTSPTTTTSSLSSPPASRSIVARKLQRTVIRKAQPTAPPTPDTITFISLTLQRPGGFAFDEREGQYFQVFRIHTANELSGFFDSEFWTSSVLQESHSEAAIRHAVVALGALYKTLEKASESPPGSPNDHQNTFDTAPTHYSFALQQYGKALTQLRESIQNNETGSQRTILISIILFTCFQSFTGDHKAAISQIQSGLGLLEERRQNTKQQLIRRRDDVEDELVQMFTRLAIQAKSYDMAFHFPHPYVIRLSPNINDPTSPRSPSSPSDATSSASEDSNIPEVFASSQEAREALDALVERIMRLNEALSSFHPGPNNILPRSVQHQGLGFHTALTQWSKAFQPLLDSRRSRGISNTERACINVLKMMQLMSSVLFLMAFSSSEMEFETFTTYFKDIVDLAKEVVVDEELSLAQQRCGDLASCRHRDAQTQSKRSSAMAGQFPGLATHHSHVPGAYREEDGYLHIKASFALDLGIVPPLFVVATKCRNRKLRRDAIRLLMSSPRREGMWDSILSGRVAKWIMEIEEEGMVAFDAYDPRSYNQVVQDERRVMVKEILFDLQSRQATLRCGTRGKKERELDERARETTIWW